MPSYSQYRSIFRGKVLPLAYIDLGLLDQNSVQIRQRSQGKAIRLATKSIRCRSILRYILESNSVFRGLMTFSPWESVWLAEHGFDDILLGYPTVDKAAIRAIGEQIKEGKKIMLMVDGEEQIQLINQIGQQLAVPVPVCLDIDLSLRLPGLHFGVKRSPIRCAQQLSPFLDAFANYPFVQLKGLMGYEAQIAGLGNAMPGQALKNFTIRQLQYISRKRIRQWRTEALGLIQEKGFQLDLVNGGGTGSIESTIQEAGVTEVTVGSGFFHSHLFDHYRQFKGQPAAGFALPIVRQPEADVYTCWGGGYIASGAIEAVKAPQPYLPTGVRLDPLEGAGEVQTPIHYHGTEELQIGDPIFFRHSKAGELCERFNRLHLIRDGKVLDQAPTYRGEGQCFL